MQTVKQTHLEVSVNQAVGIVVGWLIVYLLFPLFDYLPQHWVATISTALFFVSSYARSYLIRRFFNQLNKNTN